MPIIIKNGKVYGDRSVTLSQAEYNALSEVEKNNGTTYFIHDVNGVVTADDVALDGGTVETLAGSVATIESSPALATHAVGDYILWNGQLYTVTAAIAAGETLTLGTNIASTNVGSELTALNNGLTALTYPVVSLNSSYNMNNVDCGIYYQGGGSMPSNAPSGANNAYIIVLKARSIDRIQLWVSVNTRNIQMRSTSDWSESTGTGTNWSSWATV